MVKDEELVRRVAADPVTAELEPRQRALLDYAVKLARSPEAMNRGDVQRLREAGYEDDQILDAAQITAYFSFVNRMAQGLGIELESYWEQEQEPPRDEQSA